MVNNNKERKNKMNNNNKEAILNLIDRTEDRLKKYKVIELWLHYFNFDELKKI